MSDLSWAVFHHEGPTFRASRAAVYRLRHFQVWGLLTLNLFQLCWCGWEASYHAVQVSFSYLLAPPPWPQLEGAVWTRVVIGFLPGCGWYWNWTWATLQGGHPMLWTISGLWSLHMEKSHLLKYPCGCSKALFLFGISWFGFWSDL